MLKEVIQKIVDKPDPSPAGIKSIAITAKSRLDENKMKKQKKR
jgi:hypothetical protein